MRVLILMSALVLIPSIANADGERSNFYVSGKLGASFMDIDDIKNTSGVVRPARINIDYEDDTVFAAALAGGYDWSGQGVPIRTEIEYTFRSGFDYDPNPTFVNAATPSRAESDFNAHTFLINAFYDLKNGSEFTPYVGGGFGMALNHSDVTYTNLATGESEEAEETALDIAGHVGGGVGYTINERTTLDLGYRYLWLGDVEYGPSADVTAFDHNAHEVLLGLRYHF